MDIKDRIKIIMDKENILSGAFAETVGVQQSTLSHILNGRNNPSLDVIIKIHQKYNYINIEWLLYGTGDMTNNVQSTAMSKKEKEPSLFANNLPFNNKNNEPHKPESRKELASPQSIEIPIKETIKQEIKYIEMPARKITEIRIFFDDNTFEIFKSGK
jgi:transcriptional regulator with XRE-family HTH domain